MWHRSIHWPTIIAWTVILAAVVVLGTHPQLMAPLTTRLLNRYLTGGGQGELKIRAYHPRLFAGLDLYGLVYSRPQDDGGLTIVSVDTLEMDFRLRDVLGRDVHLHRARVARAEVYHHQGRGVKPAQDESGRTEPSHLDIPRLHIDTVAIDAAAAQVSSPDGRLVERVSSFGWRGEVAADGHTLRLFSRGGHLDWDTRDAHFARLYGESVVDDTGVRTEQLEAMFNGSEVTVQGRVDRAGPLDLRVNAERVESSDVADLTGLNLDFAADGALTAHIRAAADTVRLDATFTGDLISWHVVDATGTAVITPGLVDFRRVRGRVNDAMFDGAVTVTSTGDGQARVVVDGDAADLDLAAGLVPEAKDLPETDGHGRLRILHTTQDNRTRVTGTLADGRVAVMPFDTCRVDVVAWPDSLDFRRVDLQRGSIHAWLVGTSDHAEIFDGTLTVDAGNLRDVPSDWGLPAMRGRFAGGGALHGPIANLDLIGQYRLGDAAVGPLTAGAGDMSVSATDVLGDDWSLQAAVTGTDLALRGVPLGEYLVWGQASARAARVDSFLAVRGDTLLSLRGTATLSDAGADIALDRLRVDFAGNSWQTTAPARIGVGPRRLQIPALRVKSAQGVVDGRVDYHGDAPLDGELDLEQVDLDFLVPLLPEIGRPGGRVTARARLGGTPDVPEVDLWGTLAGASFPLARVDTMAVNGSLRGGVVTLQDMYLGTEYGLVLGAGSVSHPGTGITDFWPGADLDLELTVTGGDWAFLDQFALPALDRLSGRVDGQLHVGGTSRSPEVTGQLDSAPFNIHWLHLDRLTGSVHADASQLTLADLQGQQDQFALRGRLEIPVTLDFLSSPTSPLDGPFYARITVPHDSDLQPLAVATNAFVESSGRGEGEITISGPLAHPQYQGEIAIRDAGFVLRNTEEVYHDCFVRGVFGGDVLTLTQLHGEEGMKGTLAGTGTVTFDGLKVTGFDVQFDTDRFLLASIPDLRALVRSRNARITGVSVGPDDMLVPKFTGDLELIRGRYTGTFAAEPGADEATVATVSPAWLADVHVTGPPRTARILNRNYELDMSGDVTVVRDEDGLFMRGRMDVDSGRLPVFNNSFKVVRGRLDFSREVGLVPQVDLDAETRVRLRGQAGGTSVIERLTVHAAGPLNAPEITYSSESGYPRDAIERMLMGLSPYPDEQGDRTALANASLGAGLNVLEREIAGEMGFFDTVELEQIQRQQPGGAGLDPLIGLGKYLWNDLYVKYAQGLNADDRDLLVEYQITNHLLLQTEIRRRVDEYQGDATYNVDLKYRFEY